MCYVLSLILKMENVFFFFCPGQKSVLTTNVLNEIRLGNYSVLYHYCYLHREFHNERAIK